ncbi:iron-siderophore ABC transporter substrate-binding protein [Paenibacillus psychroresistens]|uniref:Iron-siderophore ABC transporter substrate-binding protein n=1 Tax=Paenibacillus psychroresistens TaxID=1778678 RepID=A0A6B8RGL7_9BACL|nr:iron-siderophore ABC transporter substrate-binding protein [Paenibacillus psychroresistens]QGQ94672.1 iron-siderophore ABC transporter substrate-binding protein [Paenibacillus psychroresistens]
MRIKTNKRLMPMLAVCLLFMAIIASACSNKTETNTENSAAPNTPAATAVVTDNAASPSPEASALVGGSFPRTVDSANGPLTIEKKPQKVALVHWGLMDDLLTFDLPSIGLALPFTAKQSSLDTEQYKPYADKFSEVVFVGENTEVNLEALLAYEPDLILAGTVTNEKILKELSQIAPTLLIDEEKTNVWGDWQAVVTKFGEALGQEENAQKFIDEYAAKVVAAKLQLSGIEGTVAFVQVREKNMYLQGTNYADQFYEALGLTPPEAAKGEGAELTLEGLSVINPDHLVLGYFNYTDTTLPALSDEWGKSEVWKKLKAVEQGHVYGINGALAFGFGPIGRAYGMEIIAKELKSK